jgi:hypothetical protein
MRYEQEGETFQKDIITREMNPTCTFSHQKADMLVQNGSIRTHFGKGKYTHKLPLGRGHSWFTSGIIKE